MCEQCQKSHNYKEKLNAEVKKGILIFLAEKESETENGLKGYYNTESRACTKKNLKIVKKRPI